MYPLDVICFHLLARHDTVS